MMCDQAMRPAWQVAIYLIVSMLLYCAIVISGSGAVFVFGGIPVVYGSVIGMLLSAPIYKWIYGYLYRRGFIEVLNNKRLYMFSQVLLFILLAIAAFVVINICNSIEVMHSISNSIEGYDRKKTILHFVTETLPSTGLILVLPFLLVISPLSFVIHDKSFARAWFFFLCILFSLPLVTIPFIWIPMIVYYPLMIKFTSRARENLE